MQSIHLMVLSINLTRTSKTFGNYHLKILQTFILLTKNARVISFHYNYFNYQMTKYDLWGKG